MQFDLGDDLSAQGAQRFDLLRDQRARCNVQDTERTERMAVGGEQRRAGIKSDVGMARDQRVAGKARVGEGVGDDEHFLRSEQRLRAKSLVPGNFAEFETVLGFEPDAVSVHQSNERHGRAADQRRQPRQLVERGFGRGVEHPQTVQRGEAVGFIGGKCSFH